MILFRFCISLSLISLLVSATSDTIQHVHLLFRHGDRSPIENFPNDGNDFQTTWPAGRGQLTDEGIVQQYELGCWLRARYKDFLPKKYNASLFHMRSSDIDRTLMSAQANMAGFYRNSTSPLSNFGINWSPIPVHTVRVKNDILLGLSDCHKLNRLQLNQINSTASLAYENSHRTMFDLLNAKTGLTLVDRRNVWIICDDVVCLQAHNHSIPDWLTPILKELQDVCTYYWNLKYTSLLEIVRLEIGVFLHSFVDHVTTLVDNGDASSSSSSSHVNTAVHLSTQHLMAYSAHDTDVAYLLAGLGVYDGEPVNYAATVMLELLGPMPPAPRDKYRLRVVYKRDWKDTQAKSLQLEPCHGVPADQGCDLSKVLNFLQKVLLDPKDYQKTCADSSLDTHSTNFWSVFGWIALTISIFALLIGVCLLFLYRHYRGHVTNTSKHIIL